MLVCSGCGGSAEGQGLGTVFGAEREAGWSGAEEGALEVIDEVTGVVFRRLLVGVLEGGAE